MRVIRSHPRDASKRLSATFTGDAWGDLLSSADDDPLAYLVTFAPGARTYWHRHAAGQLIQAVRGSGLVVRSDADDGGEEDDVVMLRPGQSVWTPAGERHWHGARPGHQFVHATFSFGEVEWLDEVSNGDYARAERVREDHS